jgi:hypothetical protein
MRALELANVDVKILLAAMTLFALLVVLLLPDACIDPSLRCPDWIAVPIPE